MSFQSIISSFISQINSAKTRYDCMSHATPSATITAVNAELTSVSTAILTGLDSLFDDPDISSGAKLNFLIINGYADAFKNAERWNVIDDEFYPEPNYYQCRGLFYKLADIGSEGSFLNAYAYAITNCVGIMATYQSLYTTYVNPPETVKLDQFWLDMGGLFNTEMMNAINVFTTLKNDFNSIPGQVNSYKDIVEVVNLSLAIGNVFIDSIDKEASVGNILSTSFSNIDTKFSMFNSNIAMIYSIHKESVFENEKSKNYTVDVYHQSLKRIQKAKIMEFEMFFNVANSIWNTIGTLVSKYS